jgi:hypothetical protein
MWPTFATIGGDLAADESLDHSLQILSTRKHLNAILVVRDSKRESRALQGHCRDATSQQQTGPRPEEKLE